MRVAVNGIAERISFISVSSTMKVAADAENLRARGVDVVDFGAGEPDFPTPANIKQAAILALERNFTKYTATGGTRELKEALVDRHAKLTAAKLRLAADRPAGGNDAPGQVAACQQA